MQKLNAGIARRLMMMALLSFVFGQTCLALPCTEDTTFVRFDPPLSTYNAAVTLYVSPTGNTTNPGSIDQPLATIEGARDKLRAQLGSLNGNAVVFVRGGTYNLNQTIVFTNQDGGKNGHKVTYTNYPGETVFLNAGVAVTGWQKDAGNVYKVQLAEVKSGSWWFRGLYIDGKRGELKNTETVTYPTEFEVNHSNASTSATASLCTKTGDWALDKSGGTLFYNAGTVDPNTQKIFAEKLTCAIRILGALGSPVKNLELHGFDIMYTYHPLGSGYNGWCGGLMTNKDCVLVAVEVEYADSVTLQYLRVAHASGSGIGLGRGAAHTLIDHCSIEDMGCDGITMCWTHNASQGFTAAWEGCGCDIEGPGSSCVPNLTCTWSNVAGNVPMYNTVTDCDISNFSMIYEIGNGITARHSYGNVLTYNRITGGNYNGVAASEGLFKFNYNEVASILKDPHLWDGGGVYHSTQGGHPKPEFRGNFFHDMPGVGVYLDERGDSAHVYENVSINCFLNIPESPVSGDLLYRLNNTFGHTIANNIGKPTTAQICSALATTGPRRAAPPTAVSRSALPSSKTSCESTGLAIESAARQGYDIEVIRADGRRVPYCTAGSMEKSSRINALPPGVYLIQANKAGVKSMRATFTQGR